MIRGKIPRKIVLPGNDNINLNLVQNISNFKKYSALKSVSAFACGVCVSRVVAATQTTDEITDIKIVSGLIGTVISLHSFNTWDKKLCNEIALIQTSSGMAIIDYLNGGNKNEI